jgi:hypothetical protein
MRRGRNGALIVLAGVLMVVGFEVLHFVRGKMVAEEHTLQSAAMQYARVRNLYAEHTPR